LSEQIFLAKCSFDCSSYVDIILGLADPAALPMAIAAMQGCQLLGMPEADILLSECAVYLARFDLLSNVIELCYKDIYRAPKSREMQHCLDKAKECIKNHKGPQPSVPLHLRNAPTRLMKDLGLFDLFLGALDE
jgi:putative ATPase